MAARARNARVRGSVLNMGQNFEKFTEKQQFPHYFNPVRKNSPGG